VWPSWQCSDVDGTADPSLRRLSVLILFLILEQDMLKRHEIRLRLSTLSGIVRTLFLRREILHGFQCNSQGSPLS
jgi:hypothetical protein